MKKILFYARDPGAANCVIPVYKKIRGAKRFDAALWGKDFALDFYKKEKLLFKDISALIPALSRESIKNELIKISPDVIVSGVGSTDLTDRMLWLAAKDLKIPTVVILDQWQNYIMRFSMCPQNDNPNKIDVLPEKICIMDGRAKRDMLKLGFPLTALEVTGQPHFASLFAERKKITAKAKSEFKKKIGIGREDRVITFVSEPITESYKNNLPFGYNQFTILEEVSRSLQKIARVNKKKNFFLIIKLHPRNDKFLMREFLKKRNEAKNIKIFIADDILPALVISVSDLVLGMSSMLLLEAVLAKKPILSVQIGLKRKNPFILSMTGQVKTILTAAKLYKELDAFVKGKKRKIPQLAAPVHPVDNVIKVIKNFL